jgi:hypothetical protein
MPNDLNRSIVDGIETINKAFRRFVNRKFYKSRVLAGIKGVEFTVTENGKHVHIHLLLLSDFIPVNAERERAMRAYSERRGLATGNLNSEWRYCLRAVGVDAPETVNVWVRDARRRDGPESPEYVSLEKALQETTKYLTKSDSWLKVAGVDLVAVAEVVRWPRMFELLGAARQPRGSAAERRVRQLCESDPRDGLHVEVTEARDWRETPAPGVIQAAQVRPSSLDTQSLFAGGSRKEKPEREQATPWRALLLVLEWEEWREVMRLRFARTQRYRRAQLAKSFPYATFRTLAGGVWYGCALEAQGLAAV